MDNENQRSYESEEYYNDKILRFFMSMMTSSSLNNNQFSFFGQFHIYYRCNYSQTKFKVKQENNDLVIKE